MRIELNLRHNAQFYHFLASYPGQFALSGRWRHIQNCRGRLGTRLSRVDSRKRIKTIVWTRIDWCVFNDNEKAFGTGNDLSSGGGGGAADLGLNKVKFSRSHLWNVTSLTWSPLITFDDFGDPPPPMSSFSKQIWVVPPLNSSKGFSDPPFWVLSYDWSPFCSPKNQVIPLNPPPPLSLGDK